MSRYVVSLSSVPPRFRDLEPGLRSLLNQTIPPEQVILYLNRHYSRFPDWDGTLPEVPEGVEVRMVDEDYGPATKLLPALEDFAEEDVEILFCDDDQIYPPYLAEELFKARLLHPEACIAGSGMTDYDPLDQGTKRQFTHHPRCVNWWKTRRILETRNTLFVKVAALPSVNTWKRLPRLPITCAIPTE